MKVNRVRQNVFPVAAAMIWGTSFVAQSVSADYVLGLPKGLPYGLSKTK